MIDYIAFEIQGKCDQAPVTLILWANRRNVFLCPVNALLWWLNASGIRSGFLFPSYDQLNTNINTFWEALEPISYTKFEDVLVEELKKLDPSQKWGMQFSNERHTYSTKNGFCYFYLGWCM